MNAEPHLFEAWDKCQPSFFAFALISAISFFISAIGTGEEVWEEAFLLRILPMPPLHRPGDLLNTLKGFTVNHRLVDIAEHRPVRLRTVEAGLIPDEKQIFFF